MGKKCIICKIVCVLAGIGALNWGLVALFGFNLVETIFGMGTGLTKITYVLVGLSGLGLLVGCFMSCPKCK